CLHHNNYPLTF
nr:immunoglobulin light chain junction region [Macaca mulatta]